MKTRIKLSYRIYIFWQAQAQQTQAKTEPGHDWNPIAKRLARLEKQFENQNGFFREVMKRRQILNLFLAGTIWFVGCLRTITRRRILETDCIF